MTFNLVGPFFYSH